MVITLLNSMLTKQNIGFYVRNEQKLCQSWLWAHKSNHIKIYINNKKKNLFHRKDSWSHTHEKKINEMK